MTEPTPESPMPCPFCGGNIVKSSAPVNDPDPGDFELNSWQIVCCSCGATSGSFPEETSAVKAWNRAMLERNHYRQLLEQICGDKRKTRARMLAKSGLAFWDEMKKAREGL